MLVEGVREHGNLLGLLKHNKITLLTRFTILVALLPHGFQKNRIKVVITISTIAQIITYAELMYPRCNDISEANQIIILNQIQDEIKNRLLRVKWENEPVISYSVADQKQYTLPTGCKPYNMIKLLVSQEATGSIDDDTEWDEFQYVGVNDDRDIDSGNYYSFINEDTAIILKDGEALATTNLEIKWFFYKEPTAITTTTQTPDIEDEYHNLFKYGLIQNVASIGDNPEPAIADYWQKKYDEEMQIAMRDLKDRFDTAPLMDVQIEEYW